MAKTTISVTMEPLWEGLVKIDDTLDDYVSEISDMGDANNLHIRDMKYHHDFRFASQEWGSNRFLPNEVIIVVKGKELLDHMKCTATLGYQQIQKTRGLIKKETYYEKAIRMKGFILEPTSGVGGAPIKSVSTLEQSAPKEISVPRLASYRATIGRDNTFNVEREGIGCFYSGSASSYVGFSSDAAYKSVTCVFVASDQMPFLAYVRKKGRILKMTCDNNGIKEEGQDKGVETKEGKPKRTKKPSEDPLQILKLRLAKGEITKEEYEELRKALET